MFSISADFFSKFYGQNQKTCTTTKRPSICSFQHFPSFFRTFRGKIANFQCRQAHPAPALLTLMGRWHIDITSQLILFASELPTNNVNPKEAAKLWRSMDLAKGQAVIFDDTFSSDLKEELDQFAYNGLRFFLLQKVDILLQSAGRPSQPLSLL